MVGWLSSLIGHLTISYNFESYHAEKTIKSGWISAVKAEQGPGYHRETIQVGVRLSTFGAVWHCRYQSTAWAPSARNAKQEPLFQVQRSTSPLLPPHLPSHPPAHWFSDSAEIWKTQSLASCFSGQHLNVKSFRFFPFLQVPHYFVHNACRNYHLYANNSQILHSSPEFFSELQLYLFAVRYPCRCAGEYLL